MRKPLSRANALISALTRKQSPYKLSNKVKGDNAESKRSGYQKLVRGKRRGSQYSSSKIHEQYLNEKHRRHNGGKRLVFGEIGESVQPIRSCAKAVEHRGEYKQGEKRGKYIEIVD